MAVLNWNPLHPLENSTFLSFFLANIKHTAASWPLQALMAEVMSEAARKSVIAMIVEKLWRMLLSGAICDRWRAATIYWWQWKDPPPPPVCQKPPVSFCLLSPAADHFSPLNAGVNRRTRDAHVCVSPSGFLTRSEVKLGMTYCIPERTVTWKLLPVNKAAWSWGYIWRDL